MLTTTPRTAVAAAVAALAVPAGALAASGSISISSSASPTTSVTLSGLDQTTTYTLPMTVDDSRGGGAAVGWNLTITSTTFLSGANTLAATASQIDAAPSATCSGGCNTDPVNSVGYPVAVPAGSPAPAAAKFFNAASSTGRGTFLVTPTVTVSIPANTPSGSYRSTITLAIVNGP